MCLRSQYCGHHDLSQVTVLSICSSAPSPKLALTLNDQLVLQPWDHTGVRILTMLYTLLSCLRPHMDARLFITLRIIPRKRTAGALCHACGVEDEPCEIRLTTTPDFKLHNYTTREIGIND